MVISEHIQKDFENLAQNEVEKSKIVRIYNPLDTGEILNKSDASTPLSMTEIKSQISNLKFPSKFHIPKEILFLEKFPRAENGKILRKEILKFLTD